MRRKERYSWLFKGVVQVFKYFCLTLFGFGVACLLSAIFNLDDTLVWLLNAGEWMLRVGLVVSCLLAISVVVESLRS